MNNIPNEQVTDRELDRLAAQRALYSAAKNIQVIQTILIVIGSPALALLTMAQPTIRAYATFYGIVVAFLDGAVLLPRQKVLRQQAAGVQELFDCDVLQLPWHELRA